MRVQGWTANATRDYFDDVVYLWRHDVSWESSPAVRFVLTQEAGQIVVKRSRRDECEDAGAAASLRCEPNWMAHRVGVEYKVTSDLRRTGVVGLLRNEAPITLNVRTFEEGVRTTSAAATAPCERTP